MTFPGMSFGMNFPIDERDIAFTLFEHLGVQSLFGSPSYGDTTREDADMILAEAWRFAREQVFPTNAPGDREGCTYHDGAVQVPEGLRALYSAYCEGGWLTLNAPEDLGGQRIPVAVGLGAQEALLSANMSFSTYVGLTRGVARVVATYGNEWQRNVVARRLFSGEWTGTMCLTEPHAGSAVGDAATTAVPDGAHYRMTGTKCFISGGEHDLTDNIVHLVLARTPGAPKGIKGLSLFIVPKRRIRPDGSLGELNDVTCTGIEEKMGLHASATCVLSFGEAGACQAMRLGEEHQGIHMMFMLMNEARIGTGLHGLGAATVCTARALAYAHERVQGVEIHELKNVDAPRVPIIVHPDVRRMLFVMKARTEGMRALLYKTAHCADLSKNGADEATRERNEQLLGLLTPLAKAHCSDVGFAVTVTAIQVFGGAGYVKESGVEQYCRDSKAASIYEGTNGIQALDLVGRKLGRDGGRALMALMQDIGATLDEVAEHPVLAGLGARLTEERGRVLEVLGRMAQGNATGDTTTPALIATPFLTLLSNLVVGWLLLQQAVVAHDQLSGLLRARGATDPAGRRALVESSDEAAFYDTKLHTASFFIRDVLTENIGLARSCLEGHREITAARL